MLNYKKFIEGALQFAEHCPDNIVSPEDAISPDLAGLRLYDAPIFGVAAAEDPLFQTFLDAQVVGPGFWLPQRWLPGAQSVLSFFLPFTEPVRVSNRQDMACPSYAWLHARIEGQLMVNRLAEHLAEQLRQAGFAAVIPSADSRFHLFRPFSSNWSERHAAYACGLGTFGLSRGLITRMGTAGRFGSVVTSAPLPVTARPYDAPFAYCTMCGSCQRNCPAHAIDAARGLADGKDQVGCSAFVQATALPPHGPHRRERYGCGKCQVAVPCERRIPLSPRPEGAQDHV